jgi:photosystem II protein PsbQ
MLTLVMTFLVSCSSPTATKPPTYTPDKIAQIQKYASTVTALRETMPNLATSIQNRDWTEVGSFIHGPFGELRQKMSYITRELLPQEQKAAKEAAQDLFTRLENIDLATEKGNYQKAVDNYRLAIKDFDTFLQLIPE